MAGELADLRVSSDREDQFMDVAALLPLLSHEMRTPLTTILAFTSLILADKAGELTPVQREWLNSVRSSAKQLNELAEHMLDLYHAEKGQFVVRRDNVQMAEIIIATVRKLGSIASAAGVRLACEPGANLPAVTGDRKRLEQVLASLVTSAIRLGSAAEEVVIRAEHVDRELNIIVENKGVECPTEALVRIADALSEPSRLRSADDRLGLGLRVAKLTIEHHGGRMWAEVGTNKCTRLCFSLPLSRM